MLRTSGHRDIPFESTDCPLVDSLWLGILREATFLIVSWSSSAGENTKPTELKSSACTLNVQAVEQGPCAGVGTTRAQHSRERKKARQSLRCSFHDMVEKWVLIVTWRRSQDLAFC